MKLKLFKKSGQQQIKNTECLNCGHPFEGYEKFCSYCGQKNTAKKLSFGNFLSNLISGFFSYDSRFWNTFLPLITKPGKVSKEYIAGKRARFVNPFQFYLNVSIIFFLLIGLSNKMNPDNYVLKPKFTGLEELDSLRKNEVLLDTAFTTVNKELNTLITIDTNNVKVKEDIDKALEIAKEQLRKPKKAYVYHIKKSSQKNIGFFNKLEDFYNYHKTYPTLSKEQALDSLGYKKQFWNLFYYQQVTTIHHNATQFLQDKGKSYGKTLLSYISISLFIFLPVFTLFLKLIYMRRPYSYMEHLVFVFHTQTVFFLLFALFFTLSFFVKMENTTWIFLLLFLIYLFKALRNFYNQKRFKTFIKFILLNSYYLFLSIIGFLIVAVLSFLTR